eukprot:scaffold1018_cov241-Pinguiococcus_pyrenoidosus.AAC.3
MDDVGVLKSSLCPHDAWDLSRICKPSIGEGSAKGYQLGELLFCGQELKAFTASSRSRRMRFDFTPKESHRDSKAFYM